MCNVINPASENISKSDQMFHFDRLNFIFFSFLIKCPAVSVILLAEMWHAPKAVYVRAVIMIYSPTVPRHLYVH